MPDAPNVAAMARNDMMEILSSLFLLFLFLLLFKFLAETFRWRCFILAMLSVFFIFDNRPLRKSGSNGVVLPAPLRQGCVLASKDATNAWLHCSITL